MQFHSGCAVSPTGLKLICFKFYRKNEHWSKNNTNMLLFFKTKKHGKTHNTWKIHGKYLKKKPCRLETTLPPDVSNPIARMCTDQKWANIQLFFDKYFEIHTPFIYLKNTLKKNPVGLKPPSRLFLVLFMMCYHCIFLFKQKQILETNTGKTL